MSDLGNRHRGDLGGALELGGSPISVGVIVQDGASVAVQHTTWMLLTLLARLGEEVVHTILVQSPDAELNPRVSPLARTTDFPDALLAAAGRVGDAGSLTRSRDASQADLTLHVGPGAAPARGWRVAGDGWRGTLTTQQVPPPAFESQLPFGPYAAACLAAAEVFRHVRLPEGRRAAAEHVSFDLWDRPGLTAPIHLDGLVVDFGLAGVGAVGTAALQTLWATRGLRGRAVIADNDPEGVDGTNLNRCVLFDTSHIGAPKATTARKLCQASELEITPIDDRYDRDHVPEPRPRMLLSAVDSNEARHGLQSGLLPAPAIAASTSGMRAELLAFGPPGHGPCLACGNPVLNGIPDDVHREQIRVMTPEEVEALAKRIGHPAGDVLAWAARRRVRHRCQLHGARVPQPARDRAADVVGRVRLGLRRGHARRRAAQGGGRAPCGGDRREVPVHEARGGGQRHSPSRPRAGGLPRMQRGGPRGGMGGPVELGARLGMSRPRPSRGP